jgi:XTP/dITP diphosphohydrolase
MLKIILATGNAHKAEEFGRMFTVRGLPGIVYPASMVGGMPPVPEDTGTFLGNARQKAQALRALTPTEFWVMADDSGLACDALNGEPGVESANYAGPKAPDAANRAKLLASLQNTPDDQRTARFICQLVLLGPHGEEHSFVGTCPGRILHTEHGNGGFGYDPLFVPDGSDKTFAELDAVSKDTFSHRGRAFDALASWVEEKFSA